MLVRTFFGDKAKGNYHQVHFGRMPLEPTALIQVAFEQVDELTTVHCSQHGHRLQFCGSGLAAGIAALATNTSLPARLRHGARNFVPLAQKGYAGFALQHQHWCRARHPGLWRWLSRTAPVAAYEMPGYALVELADAQALAQAKPRLAQMQRYSARALILTAPANLPWHYAMRYFAPQYGQAEDSATGSANALLIPYWARKLKRSRLKGQQMSPAGGEFLGQYRPPRVYLLGRAALVPNT